jgi:hypothetical protein
MYGFLLVLCAATFALSCHDQTVGFLQTEVAEYTPDSLVVKAQLDAQLDKDRIKFQYPWMTPAIEGVDGTLPMTYEITGVDNMTGNGTLMKTALTIRGNGIMSLPWDHQVPAGRYYITITIANEGYISTLDSIFTFIVE